MNFQCIRLALAYVGVIVGAGLSSGQDLLQYFVSFGSQGVFGVALLAVLNIVFGTIIVSLGSYYDSDSHSDVLDRVAHPLITRLIDLSLIIAGFVIYFVMVAGAGANLQQQFGIPAWGGALACSALVLGVAFLNFDRILSVLGVFTPIVIVVILAIAAYTFIGRSFDWEALHASAQTLESPMPNVWLSAVNYYSLCAMTGASMAFVLGGSVLRISVAERAGALGGVLIGLIVMSVFAALYVNVDAVKHADIPMLLLVREIHPAFAALYTLIIFALIFNTAFSLAYSLARRFSGGIQSRMRLWLAAIVAAGYGCSFGGFRQLVSCMYPMLGYCGLLLLGVLGFAWIREKSNISREKRIRKKMIGLARKKIDPQTEFTERDRRLFQELSEKSVADTEAIRRKVRNAVRKDSRRVRRRPGWRRSR